MDLVCLEVGMAVSGEMGSEIWFHFGKDELIEENDVIAYDGRRVLSAEMDYCRSDPFVQWETDSVAGLRWKHAETIHPLICFS